MLSAALLFLLETFLGLFAMALLIRFYLQLVRAPSRNPLSTFLMALTDWIVRPTRRFVPGLWGVDLSTLVLAWLTEYLLLLATLALAPRGMEFGGTILGFLAFLAALRLLRLSVYILMVAVVAQAVLSWINPHTPVSGILNSLTQPFLRIFQKRIPPVGNVDLSPLFVLIVCQLILMPLAWLEAMPGRLF